ncbi:hypothetical protein OS493_008836 [Desmophyllum pertusum]|uniref:Globin domain-containing protein n=1 Tax=Desmophyllum pertusum TaxID=174260 RepID=A0A9X0CZQ7_9CNID|nr:hypothetical protein OS493_008836 [Desmophyllum pertusum]
MGCSSLLYRRNNKTFSASFNLNSRSTVLSFSEETKNILKESWKLVEPVKTAAGKKMFQRLFETYPKVPNMFPTFKGMAQEEIISSRSLYLHAKRFMCALENALLSLNDAEVFLEYLMNLGERHRQWPVELEHFDSLKEALLWTLQDVLQSKYTGEVSEAWSELVDFIAATMMYGIKRVETK